MNRYILATLFILSIFTTTTSAAPLKRTDIAWITYPLEASTVRLEQNNTLSGTVDIGSLTSDISTSPIEGQLSVILQKKDSTLLGKFISETAVINNTFSLKIPTAGEYTLELYSLTTYTVIYGHAQEATALNHKYLSSVTFNVEMCDDCASGVDLPTGDVIFVILLISVICAAIRMLFHVRTYRQVNQS